MRGPSWVRALLLALLGAGLLSAAGLLLYPYSFGLSVRHRNETVAMPVESRNLGGWTLEDAFPGLAYDRPVALLQRPGAPQGRRRRASIFEKRRDLGARVGMNNPGSLPRNDLEFRRMA